MTRALGIDVGFASFGWAIAHLEASDVRPLALGLIRTEKDKRKVLLAEDNHRRAQQIVRELTSVFGLYPDIGIVCAETIAFVRSASVMSQIGRVWGIVDTLVELRSLPLVQASPQEIKKAVCPGVKNASKEDVQLALETRFGHVVRSQLLGFPKGQREHPADALGAILACQHRDETRLARSRPRTRQTNIDDLVAAAG